jgi:hypothetical protein
MHIDRRQLWRAASIGSYRFPTKGLLVAVIALALLLIVVTVTGVGSVRDLPAPANAAAPQALGNGEFLYSPRSSRVTIGAHYRFQLYTHCGLDWPIAVDFDGSFWDPAGPGPASDGNGNPPPGYGNPFDHGVMTLRSQDLAEYRSAGGPVMRFSRHPGTRRAYACM